MNSASMKFPRRRPKPGAFGFLLGGSERRLSRHSVGIDLEPSFLATARGRLSIDVLEILHSGDLGLQCQ